MKVNKILGLGALTAALIMAMQICICGLAGAKEENRLSIQGSTTVLPIAQPAAEEYMDLADMGLLPEADITVRGGGSGVGIAALLDGTIDIANASRPIKPKEVEKAKAKGIEPFATVIAKDGIAVIIHPSNPVKGLSIDDLRAIYTGQISRWNEVGGETKQIVVISRDTASGTFETFNTLALKKEKVRDDALMLASNQAIATTVAKTPGAIGYIGLGYLSDKVKALEIDEVEPSQKTVVSGEYKLSRPLFMYISELASPRMKEIFKPIIELLAGIPSVVFCLFGLAIFVKLFGFGVSVLSGSLTLGILILPVIIRASEEAIGSVPSSFKEASFALGATKWQTIRKVVLPNALPGILTGAILSIGRAAGETAPILFTAATFYTRHLPKSPLSEVMALPYHIYALMTEGTKPEFQVPIAYGTALVLLLLVFTVKGEVIKHHREEKKKKKK